MKLHFIGADHEVTGSLHYLDACGLNVIVDFGMEQGINVYENADLPIPYADIDYILLTHAHIDHAGMIPYAYKNGFHGQVICTKATKALAEIMLRDSAYIQESDAKYRNKKAQRAGLPVIEPIYDLDDANGVLNHFVGVDYDELIEIKEGFYVRFVDAGHLLGSASIEVYATELGITKKIVFSGDIGNFSKPLIRDPQYLFSADYVIMESTYGHRNHDETINHISDLVRIIQETLDRGGNVVLPAFAVGRTQELLYLIRRIKDEGLITGHDDFPVYVDSPLAVEATHIFNKNLEDCYDDETKDLVERGINPIFFKGLNISVTAEESRAINQDDVPKVIISASGMCDAGRIRHHLKHNLWRPESSIVFAGYQAEGTLGRVLLDGADMIKLFGEPIEVKAHIETMQAMSSHADQYGLIQWLSAYKKQPTRVFLVHGDDNAMAAFTAKVQETLGYEPETPYSGSIFNLISNKWITLTAPIPYEKDDLEQKVTFQKDTAYGRLMAAYNKLLAAVQANQNGANKDLAKFTSQILNLYDKWF